MNAEELVPLSEAAQWFPKRKGQLLSTKAIRRRIMTGSKGVALQAIRDGREWFTCEEWVKTYIQAVTDAARPRAAIPRRRKGTPPHVKRTLAKYGIIVE